MRLPKSFTPLTITAALLMLVAAKGTAGAATFSVIPAGGSTVSGTFSVSVNLSELAGKQVSAVDIILNYEPTKLEAQSITNGIFASYPLKTIDSSTGKIAIGASASVFSPVKEAGVIATITFKTLAAAGTTSLNFDFEQGSKTDSNITEAGTNLDLLTQPAPTTYALGAGSGTTTPEVPPPAATPGKGSPAPTATAGASPSGTPQGGVVEPTIFVLLLGLFLIGWGSLRPSPR